MVEAEADLRSQRSAGMAAIGVGTVVALVVWFAIDRGIPPLRGMEDLGARMVLTLKCFVLAVLFALAPGVEAVAHERLASPAFDPLSGYETRRLRINKQYLQNTLEQTVVFAAAIFGLAVYCPDGAAMRAVVATTAVWLVGRWAFWVGYHRSAAMRGLGAPGMAASMIALIYVAARVGADVAGPAGALAVVLLFLAGEGVLVWSTRTAPSAAD